MGTAEETSAKTRGDGRWTGGKKYYIGRLKYCCLHRNLNFVYLCGRYWEQTHNDNNQQKHLFFASFY